MYVHISSILPSVLSKLSFIYVTQTYPLFFSLVHVFGLVNCCYYNNFEDLFFIIKNHAVMITHTVDFDFVRTSPRVSFRFRLSTPTASYAVKLEAVPTPSRAPSRLSRETLSSTRQTPISRSNTPQDSRPQTAKSISRNKPGHRYDHSSRSTTPLDSRPQTARSHADNRLGHPNLYSSRSTTPQDSRPQTANTSSPAPFTAIDKYRPTTPFLWSESETSSRFVSFGETSSSDDDDDDDADERKEGLPSKFRNLSDISLTFINRKDDQRLHRDSNQLQTSSQIYHDTNASHADLKGDQQHSALNTDLSSNLSQKTFISTSTSPVFIQPLDHNNVQFDYPRDYSMLGSVEAQSRRIFERISKQRSEARRQTWHRRAQLPDILDASDEGLNEQRGNGVVSEDEHDQNVKCEEKDQCCYSHLSKDGKEHVEFQIANGFHTQSDLSPIAHRKGYLGMNPSTACNNIKCSRYHHGSATSNSQTGDSETDHMQYNNGDEQKKRRPSSLGAFIHRRIARLRKRRHRHDYNSKSGDECNSGRDNSTDSSCSLSDASHAVPVSVTSARRLARRRAKTVDGATPASERPTAISNMIHACHHPSTLKRQSVFTNANQLETTIRRSSFPLPKLSSNSTTASNISSNMYSTTKPRSSISDV